MRKGRVLRKRILAGLLALTVVLGIAGCGKSQQQANNTGEQSKKFRVAAVFQLPYIDFFVPTHIGAMDAAKEFGLTLEYLGPETPDVPKQIAIIESELSKGIDGLIVQTADPNQLKPVIEKARAKGIPVINTNNTQEVEGYDGFCGARGEDIGKLMAETLVQNLKGEGTWAKATGFKGGEVAGKVAFLVDLPGSTNLETRVKGARDYLKQFPGIKDVGVYDTTASVDKGQEVVNNILTANPDLKAIISVASGSTAAAGLAVKQRGLKGKVIIVGMDLLTQSLELMKEGYIAACIGQNPYMQGYLPVKLIYEYLAYKKPIPKVTPTDLEVVDLKNVDQIMAREKEYLEKGTKLQQK